ncbi:prepilin-type N-terminal cleavage/methylation domain-containing protein [Phragmitibacter flavus]|uniref:prepilin-type N-terminal cleavage/methylation domain-containing protein n=1 Tax=Phragmitibacter flavus TaxID=2576071 RepID=UPI00197E0D1A|nr:prepilin-type N-terminal cleavage/methylation domain-containing protein [Phragmitibacter flavus]
MQRPQRPSGFTLIELIVVVAVIAVLVSLTAMTVMGLQSPGSRQGAMLQITQALEEARMTAIEQSATVYVGFADAGHPDEEKKLCAHLLFREYTTEEVAAMTAPPAANTYKALTGWNLLPKGFYLDPGTVDSLLAGDTIKMDVVGLPGEPESVYAIAFGSLGQVVKPEQTALAPMVVMPAELVDGSGALKKVPNSDASAFSVQINRFTGRVKTYDGLPVTEPSGPSE